MEYEVIKHHGVKGMHWGVITKKVSSSVKAHSDKRKAENEKRNKLKKGYSTKKPTTKAEKSAARTYYRQQRTHSFNTYRNQEIKLARKEATLTSEQIKNGRYRIANARNIKLKSFSAVMGVGTTALIAGSAPLAAPIAGLTVAALSNYASGGSYYAKEKRAYGDERAKVQSKS